MQMTSLQATTFLIGEYLLPEEESSPVFTVADGIVLLSQSIQRNSMVRKMQVAKMRGQARAPGLHTFRIDENGIRVFSRAIFKEDIGAVSTSTTSIQGARVPMGIPDLDEMLGGGLPTGYSMLVVGPSGSGKTVLTTQYLSEGVRRGGARCDCGV